MKEDEVKRANSTRGEKENAYNILFGKPEGKRPLGITRSSRENNIDMDLRKIGWGVMVWFNWLRRGTSRELL
jgi:hypothetical protein